MAFAFRLAPTVYRYTASTQDALLLFEACLTGNLNYIQHEPPLFSSGLDREHVVWNEMELAENESNTPAFSTTAGSEFDLNYI